MTASQSKRILFVVTLVWGILGCSPAPESPTVYVDLGQAQTLIPGTQPTKVARTPIASDTVVVAPTSSQKFALTTSANQVREAFDELVNLRKEVVQRVEATSNDQIDKRLTSEESTLELKRKEQYYIWMDEASKTTRKPFDARVDEAGRLRLELANLVGIDFEIPDRTPRNKFEAARWERAKEIRTRLDAIDSEIDAEVRAIYNDVARRVDDLKASDDKMILALRKRLEADRTRLLGLLSSNTWALPTDSPSRNTQVLLKKVPESSLRLPAAPAGTTEQPGASPVRIELEALRRQVKIWSELRGYKLSEGRTGARDATQEFLQWQRTHAPGP